MRIIFSLLLIVLFIACGEKKKENNVAKEEVVLVKLAPIGLDTGVTEIQATGVLTTENEWKPSFKIGGIIETIKVKEGDYVKKGQLIATLIPTEISAQTQQTQLALEKAQRDYNRVNNLYKDSVATLEQLQNAKTALDIAKQNLQIVSFNQQYSKIISSVDGFVVKKLSNAGELAAPGNPILLINDLSGTSKWILRLGVADREWASIQTGNKAAVTIDAFPTEKFEAFVSKRSLAADPASGSFLVELQVNFGKFKPAVGMFGKAKINANKTFTAFSIPYEALLEADGNKGFVFVTNDKKTVKRIPVTIQSIQNNEVNIAEGLQGYGYVVVTGSPYLNEKSIIKVAE